MFDKIIEKAIREHVKAHDYLADLKGIKVLGSKFREHVECFDGETLVRYDVVCSIKAGKYDAYNRAKFQVNIYDNPTGTRENNIAIYYDGAFYAAE